MASQIHILPQHLANKIAAGEVVQRPDSVVKELIENSFDAGVQHISIVVEEGGKRLVKIVDDGEGMSHEDAVTAFQRHATSKISSAEDLETISTYGFRGEALPAIASVARVRLTTREASADLATVVCLSGSGEPEVTKEKGSFGTSVSVHDLFYNLPARRKFLKSTSTEFRHVCDTVQRQAFSHPEVAMKFFSDGKSVLDLKAGTQEQRVGDILGDRQMDGVIGVAEHGEFVTAVGYVGKPGFARKARGEQYLFLNKRFIVNRQINHAVISAYEHHLLRNTYPFFLLFLDIDPRRFDVNVHPAKLEVKFEDEQAVYRFIHTLVRKCLSSSQFVPAASMHQTGEDPLVRLAFTERQHSWPGGLFRPGGSSLDRAFGGPALQEVLTGDEVAVPEGRPSTHRNEEAIPTFSGAPWQVHGRYIIVEIEHGLMIIDQHVAHERVLYERVIDRFSQSEHASQQLLFPRTVEFPPADATLLNDLLPHLQRIGFIIKPFGGNTFVIEGVPPDVRDRDQERILEGMLAQYRLAQRETPLEPQDALAKTFSCRAAVKAGDRLSLVEMRSLIEQLFQTRMPYVCPHGRPTALRISVDELDRRFGRK